jgi:hypothetical protein
MADQRTRLTMDILARVRGVQDIDRLSRAIDETGDAMDDTERDAERLDRAITELQRETRELNRELIRTGDVDAFDKLRINRSTLSVLQRMRAEIGDVRLDPSVSEAMRRFRETAGDAADESTRLERAVKRTQHSIRELNKELLKTGDIRIHEQIERERSVLTQLRRMSAEIGDISRRSLLRSFGDVLAALPPRIRGAIILGVGSAALTAAPLIGGAIAGAVVGAVGSGGIVGGLVSASRDARVKAAASTLVSRLEEPFEDIGEAFIHPAVQALNIVGGAAEDLLSGLAPEIRDLAPLVVELADGVDELAERAEPGIADALRAARPILRLLARELPELGETIGDVFSTLSDGSDGAILALHLLLGNVERTIRAAAGFITFLSNTVEGGVDLLLKEAVAADTLLGRLPLVGDLTHRAVQGGIELQNMLEEIKDFDSDATDGVAGGFRDLAEQIDATNSILTKHRDLIRAQTDPMFALIDAQQELREKQVDYNAAVKEFGRESPQARAAQIDLARAAVGLQGAVAAAAGTFDGKLKPAMRAALKAAGLTEDQIKGIEEQFRDARRAGDKFAKKYFAEATVQWRQIGDPPPFGRGVASVDGFHIAFQRGGEVKGPAGVDRISARLTAGEFVVRRQVAQQHKGLLRALNSGSHSGLETAARDLISAVGGTTPAIRSVRATLPTVTPISAVRMPTVDAHPPHRRLELVIRGDGSPRAAFVVDELRHALRSVPGLRRELADAVRMHL